MRTSQRLSVVRTTPTIDPRVKATIQAKKAVPRVQPRPDASICHQAPSPSGTCSRKIPRFILDVPSDGAAYAFCADTKKPDWRWRHPALMPRLRAAYTPLSFGFLNASRIGGVMGKFILIPLGGTGFMNHLA